MTTARAITRTPSYTPVASGVLQRKCACDKKRTGEKCPACAADGSPGTLQRKATGEHTPGEVPPMVYDVLRESGEALPAQAREFFEPRFGADFGSVRIHTGAKAAESAEAVSAEAYTVGRHVVGRDPGITSPAGRDLLAHELTHTLQGPPATSDSLRIGAESAPAEREAQERAVEVVAGGAVGPVSPGAEPGAVRRQRRRRSAPAARPATPARPRVGTKFTHPPGARSRFRSISAEFDGRDFILSGGGTVLMTAAAQSGRPVSVRPADARSCGGSTSDSYTNNPKYVGISDYGPIPEGTYRFSATNFATFSALEQAQFTAGGNFEDPFGRPMHGGDWGAGRVQLTPVRIVPGPRGCGNTSRRSGFYIHGGSLPGSSGCIDIDNAGITELLTHIAGFTSPITVTVVYRHPAPTVGRVIRAIGGATYPGQDNPSVFDRVEGGLRELFGGGEGD
jgi:hypothetical protein